MATLRLALTGVMCSFVIMLSAGGIGPAGVSAARLRAAPALAYVHLFGGSATETSALVAVGGGGSIFLAGETTSPDWPVRWSATCGQDTCPHAFLLKLKPDGQSIFYAAVLGGSGATIPTGLAVDLAGNAYLTGSTTAPDFPTTHAIQPHCGGTCSDAFVAKFSTYGRPIYSTFLGGRGLESANGIAVDNRGQAYVVGDTSSGNFPTVHAQQSHLRGPLDGFVTKIGALGRHVLYSTYLGGSDRDMVSAVAVDPAGEAYVTGKTLSPDLPVSTDATQAHFGGRCPDGGVECNDAFVTKLGTKGRLLRGTYLGTPGDDQGTGIAVDGLGNVFVAGSSTTLHIPSSTDPLPAGKQLCDYEFYQYAPCYSVFVTRLSSRLDRVAFSTVLHGQAEDTAYGLALEVDGNAAVSVAVVGMTESSNFPLLHPVQPAPGDAASCIDSQGGGSDYVEMKVPCDGFLATLNPASGALTSSTFLGGNGSDRAESAAITARGAAFVAGVTSSSDFPAASSLSLPKVFLARVNGTGS